MANAGDNGGRRGSRWRVPLWAVAAVILLLLPLLAMQVTDEVVWNLADFLIAGGLLFGTGLTYELVARKMGGSAYRAAVGIAVVTGLLLVWVNGAVGIIGSEDHDANLMYAGVLAVGVLGAVIARWEPDGMARAFFTTAAAQAAVAAVALVAGWGSPRDIMLATGGFVALWLLSASLFRKAARGEPERSAA